MAAMTSNHRMLWGTCLLCAMVLYHKIEDDGFVKAGNNTATILAMMKRMMAAGNPTSS